MTFADKLRAAIAKARAAAGEGWNGAAWDAVVNATAHAEGIARKKKPKGAARGRNPLFDALATAMGCRDLTQMTRNAAKACGVALADIQDVTPDLTVEEINLRATAYKRRWPDPRNHSPQALAKHWGEFGQGDAGKTRAAQADAVYRAPACDWRAVAAALHPGTPFADSLPEKQWDDVPIEIRRAILLKLPPQ